MFLDNTTGFTDQIIQVRAAFACIDTQRFGKPVVRRRAAGLWVDGVTVHYSFDQRDLHGTVCAKKSSVISVLGYHSGYIFQNELLGDRNAAFR
jgi:hypothetical protein